MDESIHFRMEGPVLEENIPLDIALIGLSNFQRILDKSYLAISGSQRMSQKSRDEFRVTFTKINKGSIDTYFDLSVKTAVVAQTLMPWGLSLTPKAIWDLTQHAFDYLKFVLESVNNDKIPKYNQTGDGMIVVNNGDGDITINQNTYNVGKEAFSDYQEMAKLTKRGVSRICALKDDNSGIEIDENNRDIFSPETKVSPEKIELTCEIFDFNKHKRMGKLAVYREQKLPPGEYNFELVGNQNLVPYIESMLKTEVRVSCLQEVSPNPFGSTNVLRLQVIDI
jgi:hypothetical protein